MDASDPEVVIEQTPQGTVRARHPALPDTWAEGPDASSARVALGVAIRIGTEGGVRAGPDEPITLRYDTSGHLDEIVATRSIHLERLTDTSFYLGVGAFQAWLDIDPTGRLVVNYEINDEAVVLEPSYGLDIPVPAVALRGMRLG